ncbi:Na+/H+ antiporter subunit E [Streptomyces sp. DSM 44917]|uniref:Na+/H+ antiporter subunit E n=1 Tax=Streptomyces boetiae TaxID=3075541 RepID=A0ABU2L941_9ACTN|nr:Na+/H+ antiporter subunit E [Streptomyces sp. DSM 44917]MDT0308091.1 Na+/H+ antiporter subunit E [Streptomyces sp. DSM 44917]
MKRRLPMLLWLWLLWVLLWGSPEWTVLAGGLVVAAAVTAAFRMPPVRPRMTPRPLRLLALFGALLADLVRAALAVGWAAVRDGPRVRAAVVEVELEEDSDLLIAVTAFLATMNPGSLVVEIDRERRRLYVHELPVSDAESAGRHRRTIQRAERAALRALAPAPDPGRRATPDGKENPG